MGAIRIIGRTSPERRCGYCHGGAGDMSSCEACTALMHADCRAELGRCTTIGCAGRLRCRAAAGGAIDARQAVGALYRTAAVHLVTLLVSWVGAAALWRRVLFTGPVVHGPRSDPFSFGTVVGIPVLSALAVVALWVSLPWLAHLPARLARVKRLARSPQPQRAHLRREQRAQPNGTSQQYLVVTGPDCGQAQFLIGGLALPDWAQLPEDQDVTLYGDLGDPALIELADGRLMLLYRD